TKASPLKRESPHGRREQANEGFQARAGAQEHPSARAQTQRAGQRPGSRPDGFLAECPQGAVAWDVYVLLLVGLGVLVWFSWWYFASSNSAIASERWTAEDRATTPEELKTFIEAHKDTPAAWVAQLRLAEWKFKDGALEFQAKQST